MFDKKLMTKRVISGNKMENNLTQIAINLTQNASNNSAISGPSEVGRDWFVLFLYLITSILAIIGNIFACLVVHKKKKMRSTTYTLIVNMAISDIIGGLVIPLQWIFCSTVLLNKGVVAHGFCLLFKSFQIYSYYVSTFSMTAIAIDRYQLICKLMSRRVSPNLFLIVIWSLGAVFTSTTFVSMRVSEYFTPDVRKYLKLKN